MSRSPTSSRGRRWSSWPSRSGCGRASCSPSASRLSPGCCDEGRPDMRLIQSIDYAAISPPVIVASAGVVVLVADLFVARAARRTVAFVLSMAGALMALGAAAWLAGGSTRSTFCLPDGCSYVADEYALFFQLLFLSVLVVVLLISVAGVVDDRMPPGEFHALLLW